MKKFKTVIIGAGVTGLALGNNLLKDSGDEKKSSEKSNKNSVLILEKNDFVGGICSSFETNGFTIDFGPHKLFSLLPGVMDEFKEINGQDNLVVKKINSLFFLGKKFQFPIKPLEMVKNISPKTISAGIGISLSMIKSQVVYNLFGKSDLSFEDYLIKGFGKKAYQILFEGYAQKVWADPHSLSRDIAVTRIPVPNIKDLIKNTFNKKSQSKINAKEFYYHKFGMKHFVEKMAERVQQKNGEILLGQRIVSVTKEKEQFVIRTETEDFICETLVSTIPLDNLIGLYQFSNPEVRKTVSQLRYNNLSLIYLFFDMPEIIKDNWIFFPELEFSFNRLSEQRSFSSFTVPEGKTVLCAEITNPKINDLNEDEMVARVVKDLLKAKIIKDEKEITGKEVVRMNNVYPVYDLTYKENLNRILDFVDSQGIITLGRYGLFNYNNIDHCFDMAQKCAEYLIDKKKMPDWKETRKSFFEYKIVD